MVPVPAHSLQKCGKTPFLSPPSTLRELIEVRAGAPKSEHAVINNHEFTVVLNRGFFMGKAFLY
jgi:hypothetical protein